MSNKFTYQTLRDTQTDVIIKLTGVFDGTGQEANNSRIAANSLFGALDANSVPLRSNLSVSNTALSYYDIQLTGLKYYVNMPTSNNLGTVEVFWNGGGSNLVNQYANSATIFHLSSSSDYGNGEQLPSILNNAANSPLGDIGVYTQEIGRAHV